MLYLVVLITAVCLICAAAALHWQALRRKAVSPSYMEWNECKALDANGVLVADCNHPTATTISHHKGHRNPSDITPADSSTSMVINAQRSRSSASDFMRVASNHFDIDSFLSVWAYINRDLAHKFAPVVRTAARIGDFRELLTEQTIDSPEAKQDDSPSLEEVDHALKLCCWLNSVEKRLFSSPFESMEGGTGRWGCHDKFVHFLPLFEDVLADPESMRQEWQEEYEEVRRGFEELQGRTRRYSDLGLLVVHTPEPVHYYALFGHSIGCDTVLCLYDGNRYEMEGKYTQTVEFHSRPVMPRLDNGVLAKALNKREAELHLAARSEPMPAGRAWKANSFKDSGPLLRLEDDVRHPLTKMQRYGHPTGRPHLRSCIPPNELEAMVVSYMRHGLQGIEPQAGGFAWSQLQDINYTIDWAAWQPPLLAPAAAS